MNTYISLLRGINVRGQKKIKMAELKALYISLKLEGVTTYIQSGNVVFESQEDSEVIKNSIETAIKKQFHFDVPVLIMSNSQLKKAAKNMPFSHIDIEAEGSRIIVFFLSDADKMLDDKGNLFVPYITNSEQLVMGQGVIYLYCPEGLGKSKLTNKLIETKLKLTSTARNFKTVNKLLSLANV